MTHDDLIIIAKKWLWKRCIVVVTEMSVGWGGEEIPDAIGWNYGGFSILVECKTSRSDFLNDKKKSSRQRKNGIGNMKYYLLPKGLITVDELPDEWGLIECVNKKNIPKVIKEAIGNRDINPKYGREILLLLSCLRRIGGLRDGISVKCYQFHTKNRATLGIQGENQDASK